PDALGAGAVAEAFGDGQQLDDHALLAGRGHVLGGDGGDALAVHVVQVEGGVEGQRGQDRCLRGGVVALDVGGRVGLGVPELLRAGQCVVECGPGGVHGVEDVVRGAVDDAHDLGDVY